MTEMDKYDWNNLFDAMVNAEDNYKFTRKLMIQAILNMNERLKKLEELLSVSKEVLESVTEK